MMSHLSIWNNEKECLEAVKNKGYALQFVVNQTEEICKEAVKNDGLALELVKDQTEEMCKLAIQNNDSSLQFVDKKKFNVEINISEVELK